MAHTSTRTRRTPITRSLIRVVAACALVALPGTPRLLGAVPHIAAAESYTLAGLGSPYPVWAINDIGVVQCCPTDIGGVQCCNSSLRIARGINAFGDVAWSGRFGGGHPFLEWSNGGGHTYILESYLADRYNLGSGFGYGFAYGLNDLGQVVGMSGIWSTTLADPQALGTSGAWAISASGPGDNMHHAFVFTPPARFASSGTVVDLGTLGGPVSAAHAINNSGQVAGMSYTADGHEHAVLWQGGTMTDLGTLGGPNSEARAINAAGQVVGWSDTADGHVHPVLWHDGTMTDLAPGSTEARASGINAAGQVVGESRDASGQLRPVLWQGGTMTDLGTFGGPEGAAYGINARGQAVGYAQHADGQPEAVIWSPASDTTPPTVTYAGNAGTYTVDQQVSISCTATDNVGVVATTCADVVGPAYGFALGTNTFSATATDAAGNVGSGSTSFTVVVAAGSLGNVINQFATDPAVARGLTDKASAIAAAPNAQAKAGALNAFINQVQAQVGKSLTQGQADTLIRLARGL